jgi:hypothetical protein
MKWEYHFYQAGSGRDFEQAEETMNNLGRTGWELVTTYTDPPVDPFLCSSDRYHNQGSPTT